MLDCLTQAIRQYTVVYIRLLGRIHQRFRWPSQQQGYSPLRHSTLTSFACAFIIIYV
jgi:hypothetical protein